MADDKKVYLGKAPDRGTIVRDNPKPSSDGKLHWTGSEPTASDKVLKGVGDFAGNAYDTVRGVLTKGALTQSNVKDMTNASDKYKRGGKVRLFKHHDGIAQRGKTRA